MFEIIRWCRLILFHYQTCICIAFHGFLLDRFLTPFSQARSGCTAGATCDLLSEELHMGKNHCTKEHV